MKTIKIKSPLTDKKEAGKLCQAGADELFCGIEPYGWKRNYRNFAINQRVGSANFSKMRDLEEAVNTAHRYGVKVHVAVNAFFYMEEQYSKAIDLIKDILDIGADGIIFADIGLLLNIDKKLFRGKDIVIGTDAVVFNSQAVDFYSSFGASRIVFPRAMTLDEIRDVTEKAKNLEYEVFIIHDLCFFVDGFCTYCKEASGQIEKSKDINKDIRFFSSSRPLIRGYAGGCRTRFSCQRILTANEKHAKIMKDFRFWDKKHIQGCGACAVYDFKKIGITSLKVLDRNLPTEEKIKATKFIKELLDILDKNDSSREEFIENAQKLFRRTFRTRCSRYDCYYPSVLKLRNGKGNTHN
ncbi:peptidase U32 family protein [Candidatus Omnitrophota bacterium]